MSRAAVRYDARRGPSASVAAGYDVEQPTAGFYRMKLVMNGVRVGIRIFKGLPLDPVTGEEMDRWPIWMATANGEPIDIDRVWPKCGGDPIDQAEHDYLVSSHKHAALHAPDSPFADPRKPVDLLTAPLPF